MIILYSVTDGKNRSLESLSSTVSLNSHADHCLLNGYRNSSNHSEHKLQEHEFNSKKGKYELLENSTDFTSMDDVCSLLETVKMEELEENKV